MQFSATAPTAPGFYAWKLFERDIPNPCWVTTDGETFWRDGKYPATVGYWCRLVPAEEVELAFLEGINVPLMRYDNNIEAWGASRAKRVAEGGS